MIPYNAKPGSTEWLQSFSASKAAAMLGLSSYMPRNKLLHIMHTGQADERSEWFQKNILDYGHEVEGLARELVETMIDDSLYLLGGQDDFGLSRPLTATVDGITIDHTLAWENKQPNAALIESVNAGVLPDEYMPQCQQIMMVTRAEGVLFTVSDGNTIKAKISVLPDTEWMSRIIGGWRQFEIDLENYAPPEVTEKPIAEAIMQLPAVVINATGGLSVCNLRDITPEFDYFLSGANTVLVTDSDFVNADSTATFSRITAKTLKLKAKEVVDQIATVSEAVRTLEFYADKFDALGLQLEKLVKSEKEARKLAILSEVRTAYVAHVAALEVETAPIKLNIVAPDFAASMKGLSKLDSVQNAVNTALANGKIESDAVAKDVRAKLAWCKENAAGMSMLFPDLQQIIYKPLEDFKLTITSRIDQHKAAEAVKLEAEIQRIRAEEQAKAEAKVQAEAVKPAPTPAPVLTKMSPAVAQDLARAKAAVAGRPSEEAIIGTLIAHFGVPATEIIGWLQKMDFEAMLERIAIQMEGTQV